MTTTNKAYIITGPTSGIGRAAAFDVARHGTVVLVARDREKLGALQAELQHEGGRAVPVLCDVSDVASVRRAAAQIVGLDFPIAGLLNNAGISQQAPTKTARGWDSAGQTGIYYDERGRPMLGSARVREPAFQDRVVAEKRALCWPLCSPSRYSARGTLYSVNAVAWNGGMLAQRAASASSTR